MKKFALAALLAATVSTPALAAGGALPKTVVPTAYDITVTPDAQAMTFSGSETIKVTATQATSTIVLNAAELAITTATLDGKPVPFALNPAAQTVTLTPAAAINSGAHVLRFAWSGKINTTAAGFFAIDYTNADGSKSRMLATQFEAPDARRFAPMFDEPAFKATFTLSAVAPTGQLAFSNMPVASKAAQGATTLYHFGTTPKMSSYLLYLGIGDMERKTVMSGSTEIGVITRKGVVDQGDFALAQAKELLQYYNGYFGQPYPLPKLDMIAGPGSSQFFGAMENWGAIFYFEPELLFDAKRATQSNRERIFTVVAHEMAHQWFGDLVTMNWWDDLWLNEGFASWMESKTAADLHPDWQAVATAAAFSREGAMSFDATSATHPVIRHVETVDQLGEAFDTITYQKGEAVIRMIESTLGPDVFRDGIRRYMAKYHYSNTETDQLWTELEAAAGKPVKQIAHDFTTQAGVPMVKLTGAKCEGGQTVATLTQGRYGIDAASKQPRLWHVPLVLGTVGGGVNGAIVSGTAPSEVRVNGCGALVLNQGKGSYTRVMYDDAGHAALVKAFGQLTLPDQVGTLGDDFALAASGDQSLLRWADDQKAVPLDANPLVWSVVTGNLGTLTNFFFGTPLEMPLRARSVVILSPVMAKVGFEAQPGESPLTSNLREALVSRLGVNGDPAVVAKARAYVAALRTNPQAIPPAIRNPILTTYAVNATPAEWEALLAIAKAEKNPVVKNGYVRNLGATKDDALARRALDLLHTDDLTAPQKASLLQSVAGRHPDMAFDWAVANMELVNSLLETSTRSQFIVSLATASNDPAMPAKVQAFAEKNLPEGSRGPSRRTLAFIAARKLAADRLHDATAAWVQAK